MSKSMADLKYEFYKDNVSNPDDSDSLSDLEYKYFTEQTTEEEPPCRGRRG